MADSVLYGEVIGVDHAKPPDCMVGQLLGHL